jgi:hypothetical protein
MTSKKRRRLTRKKSMWRNLDKIEINYKQKNEEHFHFLAYNATYAGKSQTTFWRNILPPFSG